LKRRTRGRIKRSEISERVPNTRDVRSVDLRGTFHGKNGY